MAGSVAVRQLLADLANLIDRVITTVGSEYSRAWKAGFGPQASDMLTRSPVSSTASS